MCSVLLTGVVVGVNDKAANCYHTKSGVYGDFLKLVVRSLNDGKSLNSKQGPDISK